MLKKLPIIIFIFFTSVSFIKPGQLKDIVRCEIQLDQKKIIPGNLVEMSLLTYLRDSSVVESTASNAAINFADYTLELSGGVAIYEKTRTKMTLQILDESFNDPFVRITVKLRRKKSVKQTLVLPILYNSVQQVSFVGKNGYDPRATTESGYKTIPITKNINIQFIDNTQTLTNNSDPAIIGGRGMDLTISISKLFTTEFGNFFQVDIEGEQGVALTKYVKVGEGKLEISTIGGKGGISKSGGKGGKGGDVIVLIKPELRPYFDQIVIYNYGGEGGDLWRPKVDGQQQGPYGDDGTMEVFDLD